jgi:hypothetical protein
VYLFNAERKVLLFSYLHLYGIPGPTVGLVVILDGVHQTLVKLLGDLKTKTTTKCSTIKT